MELEWKWNGTFMKKFGDEKMEWKQRGNGKEIEWKMYEQICRCKVEWKQSGNGKEMEWKERETNDFSKWIWKWNGMEKEWKWNFGVIPVESLHWNFAKFLSIPRGTVPSNSIPFHGIPLSI